MTNRLDGGLGRDSLLSGGGNDVLVSREFVQDLRLNCGKGKLDKVKRDPFDPPGKSCERPRHK